MIYRALLYYLLPLAAEAAAVKRYTSLSDLCNVAHIEASLPANRTHMGIEIIAADISASLINPDSTKNVNRRDTHHHHDEEDHHNKTRHHDHEGHHHDHHNHLKDFNGTLHGHNYTGYPYCSVSLAYSHCGKDDKVIVKYAFPSPENFRDRFFVAGGHEYALGREATRGLKYGAVGGATDAGYDGFHHEFDEVVLAGNGSINWDHAYMFGHEALGELTWLGKRLTRSFYGVANGTKLYTYFEGCGEGGREGLSQVQRWGKEYDGVIVGAPTLHFAQEKINHIFSSLTERIHGYFPSRCELRKIINATIEACDVLDGKKDGVVARTDLCKLHFNLSSIVGKPYHCHALNETAESNGTWHRHHKHHHKDSNVTVIEPAENGTVTAEGVAVVQAIYDGLHDSQGRRAYLSWQMGSDLWDARTHYSIKEKEWEATLPRRGIEFVERFVELSETELSHHKHNITYDTLVEWMRIAHLRWLGTLDTSLPDLTDFQAHGGKLLHHHGECDPRVPAAASVHYWQSVTDIMYPTMSSNDSVAAISEWYQLYLLPGGGHCGWNRLQPGAPEVRDKMLTMIEWVEEDVRPDRLNATVVEGVEEEAVWEVCRWPTRPLWSGKGTSMECVTDEVSIESWTYTFPAFKMPMY